MTHDATVSTGALSLILVWAVPPEQLCLMYQVCRRRPRRPLAESAFLFLKFLLSSLVSGSRP